MRLGERLDALMSAWIRLLSDVNHRVEKGPEGERHFVGDSIAPYFQAACPYCRVTRLTPDWGKP